MHQILWKELNLEIEDGYVYYPMGLIHWTCNYYYYYYYRFHDSFGSLGLP